MCIFGRENCFSKSVSPPEKSLFFIGTAAITLTGFLFGALLCVRTAHTGDTAFLFPVEIEHDSSGDTE